MGSQKDLDRLNDGQKSTRQNRTEKNKNKKNLNRHYQKKPGRPSWSGQRFKCKDNMGVFWKGMDLESEDQALRPGHTVLENHIFSSSLINLTGLLGGVNETMFLKGLCDL